MRPRLAPACVVAAALASGACGRDDAFARELRSSLYSAPVDVRPDHRLRLEALGPGDAAEAPPAAPLVSIGAADGDSSLVLGEVPDLAVDPADGAIYVLDRTYRQVRVFSARGEPLRRFGRRGDGPGEFQDPVLLERLPWNGGLAVWDGVLQRLTLLSPAGEVRGTVPLAPLFPGAVTIQSLRALPGGFVAEVHDDPLHVSAPRQRGHLVRLDTAAARPDTVLSFPIGQTVARQVRRGGATAAGFLSPPFFTPAPSWDVLADGGVAIAPGGPYAVYLFDASFHPRLAVERPSPPAAVTREQRLGCWETIREEAAHMGYPMLPAEELDRQSPHRFAAVRPAVTGLLADGGRVWVRRFDARGSDCGRSRTWDGYGRDGRPAGTAVYPAGFRPLLLHGERAYGVRRDSLGVWYVDVHPLTRREGE